MQAKISIKQALLFTVINYIGVAIGIVSTILIYPQDKEMLGIIRFIDACAQIMFPIIVLGSTYTLINFYPRLSTALQFKLFSFSLLTLSKLTLLVASGVLLLSVFYSGSEMKYVWMGFFLAIALAFIELFKRQATNLQRISFPTFFEKIIPKLTLPSVFLLSILYGYSYDSLFVLYIISYLIIAVVIGRYIYKYFHYKWYWSYKDLFEVVPKREYYSYSLFAFAGSFGSFFAFRVDSLMIPYFISYEANGTFSIGVALASALAIPATGVFALYAPIISDLIKKVQLKELNRKYKEVSRNMLFIGMFLFGGVLVGIEPLFKLLPTYSKLAPSIPIIYLLAINVVINISTGFNTEIISYSKYYRFNLVSILSLMGLNVGLNYAFLVYSDLGIVGVAIASLISLTLFNIAKTYYIYKKMRLWPFDMVFLKMLLVMLGVTVGVFALPYSSTPLMDLVLRLSLIFLVGIVILFYTNWAIGIRIAIQKVWKKFVR